MTMAAALAGRRGSTSNGARPLVQHARTLPWGSEYTPPRYRAWRSGLRRDGPRPSAPSRGGARRNTDQIAHERKREERHGEREWLDAVPRIRHTCGVAQGIERIHERIPRVPTQEAPEVNAERAQARRVAERKQPADPPAQPCADDLLHEIQREVTQEQARLREMPAHRRCRTSTAPAVLRADARCRVSDVGRVGEEQEPNDRRRRAASGHLRLWRAARP